MLDISWYSKTPRIRQTAKALRQGAVIAYPTEGVWGLGCDPENLEAVLQILMLKNRSVDKGLILIADSNITARKYISNVPDFPTLPDPTTWLIDHQNQVPSWITGQSDKVALRIIDHPLVGALCKTFNRPIVSTSANPAGESPARSAKEVLRYFGDALDVILPGKIGNATGPSKILDWVSGDTIRAGEI